MYLVYLEIIMSVQFSRSVVSISDLQNPNIN